MRISKSVKGGRVIMFDGPDGVGKSTQLKLAAEVLETEGYIVHATRLNGGTPIGEALRGVMLSAIERTPKTDLFIVRAMNAELCEELRHKRRGGVITLVDRSPLSIIAYQVFGGDLEKRYAYRVTDEALADFGADLVLTYQAPAAVFAKRFANPTDYFQNKPLDYFERVAAGYAEAAKHYHVPCIDATESIEMVHQATMRHIRQLL